ncbi:MAG: hypothetical protein RJA44_588 [Pseudomonadota bacterium]
MPPSLRAGLRAPALALLLLSALAPSAHAQTAPTAESRRPVQNSNLDAELFRQLFVAELELRRGEASTAYQITLDAAKRYRNEDLFRRSVDIAIATRLADPALAALKLWRQTLPRSRAAAEMQGQLLVALRRPNDAQEPLRTLIELQQPGTERAGVIAALPRLVLAHGGDDAQARLTAGAIDEVLKPWRDAAPTRVAALIASARSWSVAGESGRALELMQQAQRLDPGNEATALLALELFDAGPAAAEAVRNYMKAQPQGSNVRLGYARRLTAAHDYSGALAVVQEITRQSPEVTAAWLMQGALQIEVGQPVAAQASLERFLDQRQSAKPAPAGGPAASAGNAAADDEDSDPEDSDPQLQRELSQVYLMLAQVAEQRKDYAAAQRWLDQLGDDQASALNITQRRASLLARQGQLGEARALLQKLPERNPDELRSKLLAEVQLLREAREWSAAYDVLEQARTRLPDDPDLHYEQALLAERLQRLDDMERLLRRVIELRPDQQHAYNALGYSLAERNLRLGEARSLIAKALELAPGDPFITDSMGWVEFRLGRADEAARLLRSAYDKRPDPEIGAHLGEVLWSQGRQDEARGLWRAAQERDPGNDVLQEMLKRLGVQL